MLPKRLRVIVFVDRLGRLMALTAAQARVRRAEVARKGFQVLVTFRAPLRRLRTGWAPLYDFAARRLIALYGL